jgi:hypothetical protein
VHKGYSEGIEVIQNLFQYHEKREEAVVSRDSYI